MSTRLPPTLMVQSATDQDIDQVLGTIHALSAWLLTKGIRQWSDAFPREILETEVSRGELYVYRQGGKVLASVHLAKEADEVWGPSQENAAYLHRLTVSRELAGQKLGEAMMAWAEHNVRAQEIPLLRLVTDSANPFLPGYYKKLGYREKGIKHYAPYNMNFMLFEKKL